MEPRLLLAANLLITELNYNPSEPTTAESLVNPAWVADDFEYLEVLNAEATPVNLNGYRIDAGVDFTFPNVELAAGQRAVVVQNIQAFQTRYGTGPTVLGAFTSGSLRNSGETISLVNSMAEPVFVFDYSDGDLWPDLADGLGASLELVSTDTADAALSKWYSWRASTEFNGSPGAAGVGPLGVVINEVLPHTDPPVSDTIELYNTNDVAVDISGWYLSDALDEPQKYSIPAGTVIPANGYITFNESNFNPNPMGGFPNFALSSSEGDAVILTVPALGGLTELFVDTVEFGASLNGESFGRWPNGSGTLTRLQEQSFGAANGAPQVGPVIVSEIYYNPTEPSTAALAVDPFITSADLEFLEIHNPTSQSVDLTEWRLDAAVEYPFAAGSSLAAGGILVVVSFNPLDPALPNRAAAFRANFGISEDVVLVGPFTGRLDDTGERVQLQYPDEPPIDNPSLIPRLLQDEVIYDDLPPWPVAADGSGASLQRAAVDAFGNDGMSWLAATPTPGSLETAPPPPAGDYSGDGTIDIADIELLNDAIRTGSQDLTFDANDDSTVDSADRAAWVLDLAGTHFGDANLDGLVDGRDYGTWQANQGTNGLGWEEGDFDGNEVVDGDDFNLWLENRFEVGSLFAPTPPSDRTPRQPLSLTLPANAMVPVADRMGLSRSGGLVRPARLTTDLDAYVAGWARSPHDTPAAARSAPTLTAAHHAESPNQYEDLNDLVPVAARQRIPQKWYSAPVQRWSPADWLIALDQVFAAIHR